MSDNIWEELARSPLDPDPNEKPSIADWLAPAALAAAAGLLIGVLFGDGSSAATPDTTLAPEIATTTTLSPPPPDPIVPVGYTYAEGVGIRALAAYSQGGSLHVVVDQVVRSDNDPVETSPLYLAEWVLAGDGAEIVASQAIESIVSPGVSVVEFPDVTALPVSDPRLLVRTATQTMVRAGCNGCGAISEDRAYGEVTLTGLDRPFSLPEPLLITVGDGITLSVDQLDMTDEWGYAAWHIIDENDAKARIVLIVTFEGTDDPDRDDINPTQLFPEQMFGVTQQRQANANPLPFARVGTIGLDRAGELISESNQPSSLVLEWSAEWQHPVGDPITVPLADLVDLGIID